MTHIHIAVTGWITRIINMLPPFSCPAGKKVDRILKMLIPVLSKNATSSEFIPDSSGKEIILTNELEFSELNRYRSCSL